MYPNYYHIKIFLHFWLQCLSRIPFFRKWARPLARRCIVFCFKDKGGYSSQWGQDRFIDTCLLNRMESGIFVDIGANDGVVHSNSYFFEAKRGWSGLCVEPQPDVFEKLMASRKCQGVQGCAGSENRSVEFEVIEGSANLLSGRPHSFPRTQEEAIRVWSTEGRHRITVPCYNINELLLERKISRIDFLSIDTEGGEHDILSAMDFDRFQISVICVEVNYEDDRIERLLTSRGYKLKGVMGTDEIYFRR